MFADIRERDGFAYDAHSEYVTNRDAASFAAVTEVRNEVIEPALKEVLEEMDRMANQPVTKEELSNIKNYMSGLYLLRLETQDGLANQLNGMKTLGLPENYLETYVTRVRSVEADADPGGSEEVYGAGASGDRGGGRRCEDRRRAQEVRRSDGSEIGLTYCCAPPRRSSTVL